MPTTSCRSPTGCRRRCGWSGMGSGEAWPPRSGLRFGLVGGEGGGGGIQIDAEPAGAELAAEGEGAGAPEDGAERGRRHGGFRGRPPNGAVILIEGVVVAEVEPGAAAGRGRERVAQGEAKGQARGIVALALHDGDDVDAAGERGGAQAGLGSEFAHAAAVGGFALEAGAAEGDVVEEEAGEAEPAVLLEAGDEEAAPAGAGGVHEVGGAPDAIGGLVAGPQARAGEVVQEPRFVGMDG